MATSLVLYFLAVSTTVGRLGWVSTPKIMTVAWNFSSAIIIFSVFSACATMRKSSSTANTFAAPVRKIAWLSAKMIFSIYLAPLLLRINLYWSITQATPLLDFFFLVVEFEFAPAAAAAVASLRTTRPVQWTSTSPGVPSTLAGKVISNSMLEPMARSRSAIIYTPAALMFPVVAPSSPPLPWILIGSSSGNRFPVLASSDIHYSSANAPCLGNQGIFKRLE